MQAHQRDFLELALRCNALRFGQFTLKSGRVSPYFFNAGLINTGAALARLGRCYAQTIMQSDLQFDMLFGPAYKGIALATSLGVALAEAHDLDVPVAFNRKEAKDHGEGGSLIGAAPQGRVLIVDDVISAGTAVRESIHLIRATGATPVGILIALDRQERGRGAGSAAQEIADEFAVPVVAVARLDELLALADQRDELAQHRAQLIAYRATYGCAE